MNHTAFRTAGRNIGRTTSVITLAAICAFLTACHTRTLSAERANDAAPTAAAEPASDASGDIQAVAMAPAAPFDEKPITPMETVGASGKD